MNTIYIFKSAQALVDDEPEEVWHHASAVPRVGEYIELWSELGKTPKGLYEVKIIKWFNAAAQVGTHLHVYIVVKKVKV